MSRELKPANNQEPFELLPGFDISPEFLEELKRIKILKHRRKSGPSMKKKRRERQKLVYHKHFELGHAPTQIAEETGINLKIINSDLQYIYLDMGKQMSQADYLETNSQSRSSAYQAIIVLGTRAGSK